MWKLLRAVKLYTNNCNSLILSEGRFLFTSKKRIVNHEETKSAARTAAATNCSISILLVIWPLMLTIDKSVSLREAVYLGFFKAWASSE